MRGLPAILAFGLGIAWNGFGGTGLEVKVHPLYGYPEIMLDGATLLDLPLEIQGKGFKVIAVQSPYSPSPLQLKERDNLAGRTIILGRFAVGNESFDFFETVQREECGAYRVEYMVVPGQNTVFTVLLNGGIVVNNVSMVVKTVLPAEARCMPDLKFPGRVELFPFGKMAAVVLESEYGIDLIQAADRRQWGKGIRLQFFATNTGWNPVRGINAKERTYMSLRVFVADSDGNGNFNPSSSARGGIPIRSNVKPK